MIVFLRTVLTAIHYLTDTYLYLRKETKTVKETINHEKRGEDKGLTSNVNNETNRGRRGGPNCFNKLAQPNFFNFSW